MAFFRQLFFISYSTPEVYELFTADVKIIYVQSEQ